MPYHYRCARCRTTSPQMHTRAQARAEAGRHRRQAHGGHIPDGERIIGPPQFRDLPRKQQVWIVIVAAILILWIIYKTP